MKNKGYSKWFILAIFIIVALLFFLNKFYQRDKQLIYYPSGELKQEYFMKDGKADGPLTEYFKNGEISSIVQLKNGKQDGWSQFFYKGGQLRKKTYFKEGVQEDTLITYYRDGSIEAASSIRNGTKNGRFENYHHNGKLQAIGFYKDDKLDGEVKLYNLYGELQERSFYKTGNVFAVLKIGKSSYELINVKGNFRLEIPIAFELDTISATSLTIFSDKRDDLVLMLGASRSTLSIDYEVNSQIAQAKKENNFETISTEAIELNGLKGLYKAVVNQSKKEYKELYFIKKDSILINIYFLMPTGAKDKHAGEFDKILDSFSLIENKPE